MTPDQKTTLHISRKLADKYLAACERPQDALESLVSDLPMYFPNVDKEQLFDDAKRIWENCKIKHGRNWRKGVEWLAFFIEVKRK